MYTSGQTLKAALQSRVSVAEAERLGSQRQNLGEGMMCPAGAGDIMFDIYMRPAGQNTLTLNDSACSNYTDFSARRRMMIENAERPMLPICTAGLNGGADLMGKGRPWIPENVYGEGDRGKFVRHYPTRTNRPEERPTYPMHFSQKLIQPFTFSMDATQTLVRL